MQYHADAAGAVQLTLTAHEAQKLEDFLHLSAMSLMTWPIVVGAYMTERKQHREAAAALIEQDTTTQHEAFH